MNRFTVSLSLSVCLSPTLFFLSCDLPQELSLSLHINCSTTSNCLRIKLTQFFECFSFLQTQLFQTYNQSSYQYSSTVTSNIQLSTALTHLLHCIVQIHCPQQF